jgi:hypothetical protein
VTYGAGEDGPTAINALHLAQEFNRTPLPSTPVTSIFKLIVRARPHLPAPFLSSTRALAIAPRFIFQDAINENLRERRNVMRLPWQHPPTRPRWRFQPRWQGVYLQTYRPQFGKSSALSPANGSVGKKFRRDEMFIVTSRAD